MNEYQKTVFFNYLAMGANIATGFILIPLILASFGTKAVGFFGLLFSFKSILDIGVGWLSMSITKNIVETRGMHLEITHISLITNISYALISSILLYTFLSSFYPGFGHSSIYFAIYAFLSFFVLTPIEYLNGILKQSLVSLSKFISQLLFAFFSIVSLLYIPHAEFDYIFLSLVLSSVISTALMYFLFFTYKQFTFTLKKINFPLFKKITFVDGKHILLNTILIISILQVDIILIERLYGLEAAGVYTIIAKIPMTLIMLGWRLSEPFQLIASSKISQGLFLELKQEFFILEKKIVLVATIAALGYLFFGKLVLGIWLGDAHKIPNVELMYIIPSGLIFVSILERLYLAVMFYTDKIKLINAFYGIELLFKIMAIVMGYKTFGAISPLLGWFIALCLLLIFYRKHALSVISNIPQKSEKIL